MTSNNSSDPSLDDLLNRHFAGKVVRKDLTKLVKEGANVPVFVLEYLLGSHCASNDEQLIQDGLQTVTSSFETACKNAGLTDVTFHSLRHTFASRLVQGGVSLYETMSMMGHKSLDMVQRYAHHAPNYQDKAIEVLNSRGHNMGTVPKEPQKAAGI